MNFKKIFLLLFALASINLNGMEADDLTTKINLAMRSLELPFPEGYDQRRLIKHAASVSHPVSKKTILMWAAKNNEIKLAAALIENGADVDAKDSSLWGPLHYAAENGNATCVSLLLRGGAQPNATTLALRTP